MTRRISTSLAYLAACGLLFAACGGSDDDDPNPPGTDTGESDVDEDVDPIACELDEVPADGDTCDCEGGTVSGREGLCDRTCVCTNGFFVCEDDCSTPQGIELVWSVAPTLVEVEGNGDRDVNPGELWAIEGAVAANNAPNGVDTSLRATSASGRIVLDDEALRFSALGAEGEAFSLPVAINANATAGPVVVRVEAFTDGFEIIQQQVEFSVVELDRPVLAISDDRLEEVDGDGNPVVDAGESWQVILTVRNSGSAPAEGVNLTAAASSTTLALTTTTFSLGTVSPGATRQVEVPFTVAASPTDLTPTIDFAMSATGATTATRVVSVPVRPPDTLRFVVDEFVFQQAEGGGNGDTFADVGETWELLMPVENIGSFTISGLEFTLRNYETPLDPETGEPITDPETGLPLDDPAISDFGFELDSAPSSLLGGRDGELRAVVEIPEGDEVNGRVLVTPRSDIRQHAPIAHDILLVRP